jgi:hypothetical protein
MLNLLAIDPGNDAGWSYWNIRDREFMTCGLGKPPIRDRAGYLMLNPDILVIEIPQVYPEGAGKPVPPEDLIVLALNAGRHVERVTEALGLDIPAYGFLPATWKRQQKKASHHERVRQEIGSHNPLMRKRAETLAAQVPKSKAHNVWDGIALGWWALPRVDAGVIVTFADYTFKPL